MGLFDGILDAIGGSGGSGALRGIEDLYNMPLPVLKQMRPDLYKEVVRLNPELESAQTLGPSAMEGISTDPALRAAQMSALQKLQGISDAGGRDAQFLAEASKMQNDINANLAGNQQAIQQNLAARGLSGGATEAVQRQLAAQQAANRQAQMGLDLNAQAQQRALAALTQGAQLGGQMESQQFGQQSAVAQAKDLANRFNLENQQNVQMRNVASRNQAQQMNAQNAQNIANQNVATANQAQQYNLGLPQQQFENQMTQAGAKAGARGAVAQNQEQRRAANLGLFGGLVQAGAQAYGGKSTKAADTTDIVKKKE